MPTLAAPEDPVVETRHPAPPLLRLDEALFVDFDGTLVPLADHPAAVQPGPELVPLLHALAGHLQGALALLSGRPLRALDALLAPLRFAGAGLHGAELRRAAEQPVHALPALPDALRQQLAAEIAQHPGLLLEDKGAALAVHYRAAPALEPQVHAMLQALQSPQWVMQSGKFVCELKPRGVDKGTALRQLMAEPAFQGRQPVFLGDDRTDEDAILAAQALGGLGIKVGPGESAARHRLLDPQAVLLWLAASRQAMDRGGQGR